VTKAADIRAKSADELKTLAAEIRGELFKARIQNHTNQLDSTAKLRGMRRDIARINTVLRQQEIDTLVAETPAGKDTQS
jgi:large subunit ribosomal protein L29